MKKLFAVLLLCILLPITAKAQEIFPVEQTGMDGITRYGYMDENGQEVLPFVYAQAGEFSEKGLAVVENEEWETAVINQQGEWVIPYRESPLSVEFSDDAIAYRYAGHSVYFDLKGNETGDFKGAVGFYTNDRLLYQKPSGSYSYLERDGYPAFTRSFANAGVFIGDFAVVQLEDTRQYAVIDTQGTIKRRLSVEMTPVYMRVYHDDILIVSNGTARALYSIERGEYVTDFVFQELSEFFEDGFAMARQSNRWGIIDRSGHFHTQPIYHYLSYMGDGVYAARSQDGSASAVDADGNLIYRTMTYIGGFQKLEHELAWHGTSEGRIIFFRRNGGYFANLTNAENPQILSASVVRAVQDGKTRYINLTTGCILFEQPTLFDLGQGIQAKTVHYEKFIGYQKDGTSYGWNVDYPEIQGLPDDSIQQKINQTIRQFFLEGPSLTAEYEALEGGYGVSMQGSVLVVWANCISGKGNGSSVWNNSLAFDLYTGKQYGLRDLLKSDYITTVQTLLPNTHPIYLYSFPRISSGGVTYYYNEYESEEQRARTESFLLTFWQLRKVVNTQGECYRALQTEYVRPDNVYQDVETTHWAYDFIQTVSRQGLMHGANGYFRPEDSVTGAEICAVLSRLENLNAVEAEGPLWYIGAVTAMRDAGLLSGLEDISPEEPLTRADAMQFFANVFSANERLPVVTSVNAVLQSFSDSGDLPEERKTAAAICVSAGIIQGANGKLNPLGSLSRAEFSKLLSLTLQRN